MKRNDESKLKKYRDVPFSLTCENCDAGSHVLDSAHAFRLGWQPRIVYDDGPLWNFIGICPDCAPEYCGVAPATPDATEVQDDE